MKKFFKIVKWIGIIIFAVILTPIILIFISIILFARGINSVKYCISTETGIQENGYVTLNGTKQFISIRGKEIANPVILFLHGGPGTPMGHIAHYFQTNLEDDYTVVHWDQRGCGRTYMNDTNFSVDKLSMDFLLDDLDKLVDYLREKFGQKQVIIMGHSWGTILGTRYVLQNPEKISDYIVIGYVINGLDGYTISANKALDLAKKEKNTADVNNLQKAIASFSSIYSLENLSIESIRNFTIIRRICSKYLATKGEMSAMGQIWTGLSSPYMNIDDIKWFFTLLNFEKNFKLSLPLMNYFMFDYDANALGFEFKIPIYIIQGEGDWITPAEPLREHFEKINAPKKELILISNAGHSPYLDYPEEFCKIVKEVLLESRLPNIN